MTSMRQSIVDGCDRQLWRPSPPRGGRGWGEGGAPRDPYLLRVVEATGSISWFDRVEQPSATQRGLGGHSPPANLARGPTLRDYSRNLLTLGRRQSLPKARGVIWMPLAPCRRLYSLRSTMATTRLTVAASKPRATMSATPWSPST